MPEKYHIAIKEAPPRFQPVGKYTTVEFTEECAGSCRKCVKKNCVYNIFNENLLHVQSMKEPEYLYTCQSCFRCVQECTKGIFSRVINPEYRTLGDDYYLPDIIHRAWYQAHTGKVPVSGAGYRGPFVAPGFDAMWTDMSEIVRPTRDGIHGREYISTCFELNRRGMMLHFDDDMGMKSDRRPILEVPLPLLLQLPDNLIMNQHILMASVKAAYHLGTMLFIRPSDFSENLSSYAGNLIPCFTVKNYRQHMDLIGNFRAIELEDDIGVENICTEIRSKYPEMIILVGLPLDSNGKDRSLFLSQHSIDTLHFYGDEHGNEKNTNPRFLKEVIREIHLGLVAQASRQKINLIFSGGIAMAEHMAKAIICGADAVTADNAILLALECRLCHRCRKGLSCPVKLEHEMDTDWASQRIINLFGAWHSQLIEVMGAMGIREVRRLRGEVGRSMWFEDLEKEHFGPIFGERKTTGF